VVLLCLVAAAAAATVLVRVPETVSAPFTLAPIRGADPVRAFRAGVVEDVRVAESQSVAEGDTLLTITSNAVGDRSAEWKALETQVDSARARVGLRRSQDASKNLADVEEIAQLQARVDSLERSIGLKQQQLSLAHEMTQKQHEVFELGLSTRLDAIRAEMDEERIRVELEQVSGEKHEIERTLAKRRHDFEARKAASREEEQGLLDELQRTEIRKRILDEQAVHGGNRFATVSPCAGTIVKLAVRGRGAVVAEGDSVAEVVCRGERLQAVLELPQGGMALARPGERVKLLYDAFPYQRYGARSATIRWISPGRVGDTFRAFADIDDDGVVVGGERHPLAPGMGGIARIVVARRLLGSYVLEPIRQLRETMADAR